jgi:hypothetical protein
MIADACRADEHTGGDSGQRRGHAKSVAFLLASFDGLRRYSFVKVRL